MSDSNMPREHEDAARNDLFQLHWQNPANPHQTDFVAQAAVHHFANLNEMHDWINRKFYQHRDSCPDGWVALVCTEGAEAFLLVANEDPRPCE